MKKLPNGGTADAWVRRSNLAEGCDQKWEIAGFYLGPAPCIGQAAVLDAINEVAAEVCATHVEDCPNHCPPAYEPRAQLGSYNCFDTLENGALLQGDRVWNCACTEPVSP